MVRPTAVDSIASVLGVSEDLGIPTFRPFGTEEVARGVKASTGGLYYPREHVVAMRPQGHPDWTEQTLAHEMVHANKADPRFEPLMDYLVEFMGTEGQEGRDRMLESYYGPDAAEINAQRLWPDLPVEEGMETLFQELSRAGPRHPSMQELLARQLGLSYDLARRMHADPAEIAPRVAEAAEQYPGFERFFEFWMKGFSEIPPSPQR